MQFDGFSSHWTTPRATITRHNQSMRSFLLRIHRWAGLLLALYAVAIGITGTILVYRQELAPWIRPKFHSGELQPVEITPDEALAQARKALPAWRPLSVTYPHEASPHFSIYMLNGRDARIAYVGTRDATLIGVLDPHEDLLGFSDRLHANLLAARTGRLINGYAAILTMLLCFTGILIWWPSRSQWRTWIRLGGRRSIWRVPWDLHHALGVATFAFLFVIAFTGAYFTWGQTYIKTVGALLPRYVEPKMPQDSIEGRASLAQIAEAARRELPGLPVLRIAVFEKPVRPVTVTLRHGHAGEFHLTSTAYLDPRDASVLGVKRLHERPAGDTAIGLFSAVHFGIFGGPVVQFLWAVLGLSFAVLGVTGALMWWRGLRRFNPVQ